MVEHAAQTEDHGLGGELFLCCWVDVGPVAVKSLVNCPRSSVWKGGVIVQ